MVSDNKSILGLPSRFKNGQLNYKTLLMIKFLLPAHLYQVEVMIKFIEVDVHYIDTQYVSMSLNESQRVSMSLNESQ